MHLQQQRVTGLITVFQSHPMGRWGGGGGTLLNDEWLAAVCLIIIIIIIITWWPEVSMGKGGGRGEGRVRRCRVQWSNHTSPFFSKIKRSRYTPNHVT